MAPRVKAALRPHVLADARQVVDRLLADGVPWPRIRDELMPDIVRAVVERQARALFD
jgi:hypothetical protein